MSPGRSWRFGEKSCLQGPAAFEECLWLAKTPRRKERMLTAMNEVAG